MQDAVQDVHNSQRTSDSEGDDAVLVYSKLSLRDLMNSDLDRRRHRIRERMRMKCYGKEDLRSSIIAITIVASKRYTGNFHTETGAHVCCLIVMRKVSCRPR
jgi:hypothetical protein